MEIVDAEAATCGAAFSLKVMFLGDSFGFFLELVVSISVYQQALNRFRIWSVFYFLVIDFVWFCVCLEFLLCVKK